MRNKRVIISWILLLGWMGVIFFMSNQAAEVSNKQSNLLINIFSLIGIDLNSCFGEITSVIVRKAAHFTEYFILYFLAVGVLKHYIGISKAKIYGMLVVLGYAITDEVHQYFIPGRAMAARDVLIDSCGGITGFIIYSIYIKF